WWALAAIMLAVLTIGFDATILNVALPTLATDVHATNSQLQWMVDAYVLVLAGLLLPAGALADRYGRKRTLLVGLALFGLASGTAALTNSAGQLIAIRATMGVGAAILTPVTLAVLPVIFREEERAKAIAVAMAGMGVGVPLGPLVGGYLLRHFWWGSIFLVNAPVVVLALVGVATLVPESRNPEARRIDVLGGLLSTAGLVLSVYGIIEAPDRGWSDPVVIVALAGGVVLLAAFGFAQARLRYPMIDLGLFRNPRFLWGSAVATLASFALFGLLFVFPQYLQVVRGNDALGTGVRLIPMMAGLIVAAKVAERLVARLGTKVPVALGMTVVAAGLAWGATTSLHTGFGEVAGWLATIGFGVGLAMTPAMHAVLTSMPAEQSGTTSSVTMTMRQVGGALGVAILGSVLGNAYSHRLPASAPAVAHDSVAAAAAVAARLHDPALLLAGQTAYLHAMDLVLLVCAGIALAGAVLGAALLPAHPASPAGAGEEESGHERQFEPA
ncbi:MAG TPA: MFS transporter, partial [Rugosimonospora sp.]|nr:MFS transporter [Rugosimonospora sp.]